jgi:uncharacterized protein
MTNLITPESSSTRVDEELAGSVTITVPVNLRERISSIDVLRGVALLGILVLNIEDFAGPDFMHDLPIPYLFSAHLRINFFVLLMKYMFFEGKMRGLFSMLFGAGVILLTERAEKRGSKDVADIYTRRNMLLMLFGILHGCLLWGGDILFDYGFQALLFLYPLRRLKAKTLLWTGTILSLCVAPLGVIYFFGAGQDWSLSRQAAAIHAGEKAGAALSKEQQQTLRQWESRIKKNSMTTAKVQGAIAEATSGYLPNMLSRSEFLFQTGFAKIHIDLMADILSAMLIGMGLMKMGFFTAELSYGTYWWTAIVGFGISLPLYVVGIWNVYRSGFFFLEAEKWLYVPYYIGREAGSIAISAVVLLAVKAGLFRGLQRLLAAVGRTALSNYLLTSVICQTIFVLGPWKLYGKLAYYQQMYVVFGVWLVNLVVSPIWLRYFAFGPAEWLWRSLTYGKRQPLMLTGQMDQ